uniref:Arrowhead n=1 Tax=Anopheles farauti TaxID=69004 RepID=A0A182Q807_9DIPT
MKHWCEKLVKLEADCCAVKMKTEFKTCGACTEQITDRYIFEVNGSVWHGSCLRCTVCYCPLERQSSCYLRDGDVYCKSDYIKKFKTSCAKCARAISATDWVRRAREYVFHLACFACDSCGRQLSTGEQFAICEERVLCKTHYMELIDDGTGSSEDGCDVDGSGKNKTKRIRTTFTEEQIQILQANFQVDSNPDGQDLERIALATGLSKRVTQVWFQNSRARQKKHVHASFGGSAQTRTPIPTPGDLSSPDVINAGGRTSKKRNK